MMMTMTMMMPFYRWRTSSRIHRCSNDDRDSRFGTFGQDSAIVLIVQPIIIMYTAAVTCSVPNERISESFFVCVCVLLWLVCESNCVCTEMNAIHIEANGAE